MERLTAAHVAATVKVLNAAGNALDEWLEDEGLSYEDLPFKHRQMVEQIVVAVMLNREAADRVVAALTMPEPKGRTELTADDGGFQETREDPRDQRIQGIRNRLLSRVANLASTNKTERGLPNEISHDTGWQGALELVKEAIEEEVK